MDLKPIGEPIREWDELEPEHLHMWCLLRGKRVVQACSATRNGYPFVEILFDDGSTFVVEEAGQAGWIRSEYTEIHNSYKQDKAQ